MPILTCVSFLVLSIACGYAMVCAAVGRERMHWAILFGFSVCLGEGAIGLINIFASMLGILPSARLDGAIAIACAIGIVLLASLKRIVRPASGFDSAFKTHLFFCVLLLAAIAYGVVVVFWDGTIWPVMEWDAFAIWQLKAKVFMIATLQSRPGYFYDLALSFSHLRYPPLTSMISAASSSLVGRPDDLMLKTPHMLLFYATVLLVYGAIETERGTLVALIATAVFITAPTLLHYAASATAETALTAFTAGACVSILRWLKYSRPGDLILACLFSIFAAWTKNEGQAIAVINAIILLVMTPKPWRIKHLAMIAVFLAIVAILFLPWLLYIRGIPRTDEDYAAHLTLMQMLKNISRLPTIFYNIFIEMLHPLRWSLFWALPMAMVVLYWRQFRNRLALAMLLAVVLQFAAYILVYVVAPMTLDVEFFGSTAHRLFMHAAPPAAIVVGFLWPERSSSGSFRKWSEVFR